MRKFDNTTKQYIGEFVAVIDPDQSISDTLKQLLEKLNVNATSYSCAEAYLANPDNRRYACLVTETNLPGISGIALLERLREQNQCLPTILITQENDVSLAVRAMHAGAVDFLEKPLIWPMLLDRICQILSGQISTNSSEPRQ